MCIFCDGDQVESIDILGSERSYGRFSMMAINQAVKMTSGGCTPVCDKHRSMFVGNLRLWTEEDEPTDDNENESDNDNEEQANDDDDEFDGT